MINERSKNAWLRVPEYEPTKLKAHPANHGLPPEVIRKMAMQSNDGGRFVCPSCRTGFSVAIYGVYGRMQVFSENEYYCKDCAKSSSFIPWRK